MKPPRRRAPAPPPPVEVPAWVRHFEADDWPLSDYGDERRQPLVARQRAAWQWQRRRWCQAHGVNLGALVAEGRAQSVYAHLRAATPWPRG